MKPFLHQAKELHNDLGTPTELNALREKMKASIRARGADAVDDFISYYKELLLWSMATGQDVGSEIQAAKELFRVAGVTFTEKDGKDLSDFAKKMKLKIG